jgi:hypothetical protein
LLLQSSGLLGLEWFGFDAGANTLGQANGTAKGGAPHAHIAAYKVCWSGGGCDDTDILAAMDEAVADGVDVFSASLGSDPPLYPFFSDAIAIASFHAVHKGIVSVCSAGNAGPTPGSVTNVAPWIITVGANSLDRDFPSEAVCPDYDDIFHVSIHYPLIDQCTLCENFASDVACD